MLDILDELAHLLDLHRVEPAGRLIEDQYLGLVDNGLGDADPLLITFGEMGDRPVLDVQKPAVVKNLVDTRAGLTRRDVFEPGGELQVFAHGHVQIKRRVLGQITDLAADNQGFLSTSWPAIDTLPEVGGRYEVRMRIRVVFPAPFLPRNPTISPLPISKEMPLSASIFPKFLEIF